MTDLQILRTYSGHLDVSVLLWGSAARSKESSALRLWNFDMFKRGGRKTF